MQLANKPEFYTITEATLLKALVIWQSKAPKWAKTLIKEKDVRVG